MSNSKTEKVFTLMSITHKPASEIKFLLNGKDGKADRTVGVVQYFKGWWSDE